jgi:hypothetical protein
MYRMHDAIIKVTWVKQDLLPALELPRINRVPGIKQVGVDTSVSRFDYMLMSDISPRTGLFRRFS